MDTDLFGFEQPAIEYTGKKRVATKANGYRDMPGTGPDGETCGSCEHHCVLHFSKAYHKCGLMRGKWTGGTGTDIRVRSPACKYWEKAHG